MRVCVCVSAATCPQYCTDPDVSWQNGRGFPLVVHGWADLRSVHSANMNCRRVLVLVLCVVCHSLLYKILEILTANCSKQLEKNYY